MSLVDELQKLDDLRRSGALSEPEFRQAKAALLAGGSPPPLPPPPAEPVARHLADQLAEVRYQNELARLDREWEQEKERYVVVGRYGTRSIPTAGAGIGIAVGGGVVGVIWMAMALGITGMFPAEGPFGIVKVVFPLFGLVFIGGAIAMGVSVHAKAKRYEAAYRAYQDRRAAVRPDDFRD